MCDTTEWSRELRGVNVLMKDNRSATSISTNDYQGQQGDAKTFKFVPGITSTALLLSCSGYYERMRVSNCDRTHKMGTRFEQPTASPDHQRTQVDDNYNYAADGVPRYSCINLDLDYQGAEGGGGGERAETMSEERAVEPYTVV